MHPCIWKPRVTRMHRNENFCMYFRATGIQILFVFTNPKNRRCKIPRKLPPPRAGLVTHAASSARSRSRSTATTRAEYSIFSLLWLLCLTITTWASSATEWALVIMLPIDERLGSSQEIGCWTHQLRCENSPLSLHDEPRACPRCFPSRKMK